MGIKTPPPGAVWIQGHQPRCGRKLQLHLGLFQQTDHSQCAALHSSTPSNPAASSCKSAPVRYAKPLSLPLFSEMTWENHPTYKQGAGFLRVPCAARSRASRFGTIISTSCTVKWCPKTMRAPQAYGAVLPSCGQWRSLSITGYFSVTWICS